MVRVIKSRRFVFEYLVLSRSFSKQELDFSLRCVLSLPFFIILMKMIDMRSVELVQWIELVISANDLEIFGQLEDYLYHALNEFVADYSQAGMKIIGSKIETMVIPRKSSQWTQRLLENHYGRENRKVMRQIHHSVFGQGQVEKKRLQTRCHHFGFSTCSHPG